MKKSLIMTLLLLAGLFTAVADPGSTTSDKDSRVIEVEFVTSTTYTIQGSASFLTPASIMVTFKAGSRTNDLDINLTRDGVTRDVIDYSYTGRTFIYYFPNSLFLKAGDVLTITNTDNSRAIATLNLAF